MNRPGYRQRGGLEQVSRDRVLTRGFASGNAVEDANDLGHCGEEARPLVEDFRSGARLDRRLPEEQLLLICELASMDASKVLEPSDRRFYCGPNGYARLVLDDRRSPRLEPREGLGDPVQCAHVIACCSSDGLVAERGRRQGARALVRQPARAGAAPRWGNECTMQ
eukprot:14902742-Alexandrium_andersonii.AAC.2